MALLFGRAAVHLGFVTPEQVQACTKIQEQLQTLGVRKPLGEILREQGLLSAEQIQEISKFQEFRKEREEDKEFGKLAHANGFITEAQLKEALALQKSLFHKTSKTYDIELILLDRGFVTEQQLKAIARLQRGPKAPPRTVTGVKECGNCFEVVAIGRPKCPKCGTSFQKLKLQAKCKVCGFHQRTPGEFCSKCGANMITGQVPDPSRVRQCKKCGKIGAAYENECVHCGYTWDATMKRELRHREVRTRLTVASLARWGVGIAVAGVVAIAVWNFESIRRWFVGEDKAEVKQRSEEFLKALRYKDQERALSFYKTRPKDLAQVYSALFKLDPEKVEMTDFTIAEVDGSGTAYVTVSFRPLEGKTGDGSLEDKLQALEKGIRGTQDTRNITLKWTRRGGEWRLE